MRAKDKPAGLIEQIQYTCSKDQQRLTDTNQQILRLLWINLPHILFYREKKYCFFYIIDIFSVASEGNENASEVFGDMPAVKVFSLFPFFFYFPALSFFLSFVVMGLCAEGRQLLGIRDRMCCASCISEIAYLFDIYIIHTCISEMCCMLLLLKNSSMYE